MGMGATPERKKLVSAENKAGPSQPDQHNSAGDTINDRAAGSSETVSESPLNPAQPEKKPSKGSIRYTPQILPVNLTSKGEMLIDVAAVSTEGLAHKIVQHAKKHEPNEAVVLNLRTTKFAVEISAPGTGSGPRKSLATLIFALHLRVSEKGEILVTSGQDINGREISVQSMVKELNPEILAHIEHTLQRKRSVEQKVIRALYQDLKVIPPPTAGRAVSYDNLPKESKDALLYLESALSPWFKAVLAASAPVRDEKATWAQDFSRIVAKHQEHPSKIPLVEVLVLTFSPNDSVYRALQSAELMKILDDMSKISTGMKLAALFGSQGAKKSIAARDFIRDVKVKLWSNE